MTRSTNTPLPHGAWRRRAPAPHRIALQIIVGVLAAVLAYAIRDRATHGHAMASLTGAAVTGAIVAVTAALAALAPAWAIAYGIEAWREPGTGHRISSTQRRTEAL
jgi:hypothetical protein